MPGISVIIPAYNRAHLIGETLRSLLNQTLPAVEIIVVDDGSTDCTAKVAREAFSEWEGGKVKGGRLPELKLLFQENKGPAAARNTGFLASKGEFIHFFDSDDLAAPNKQEVQLNMLKKTGADIAVGPWIQGHFMGDQFLASNHVLQQHGLPKGDLIRALLSDWSVVPHSCLFRRSIVEKVSGFPEDLFGAEDQMMFLNCLLAGAGVVHTPGTIEFYRLGDGGKITENKEWAQRHLQEWARFLLKAREECLQHGIDPMGWFGYRRRLWEAMSDLSNGACENEALVNQVAELAPRRIAGIACRWHRKLERWRGGIEQRLTGGRAVGSFRRGPIASRQIAFLQELGYSYESPRRLPWL